MNIHSDPVPTIPVVFIIGLNGVPIEYILDKNELTADAINAKLMNAIKVKIY